MIADILSAYLVIGVFACATVLLGGRWQGKRVSFSFSLFFYFGLLVDWVLWPVWIAIQLIEWSFPNETARPMAHDAMEKVCVGTRGCAVTDLRPGGRIRVGDRLVDAIAENGCVASGQEVEIVGRMPTGFRVRAAAVEQRDSTECRDDVPIAN